MPGSRGLARAYLLPARSEQQLSTAGIPVAGTGALLRSLMFELAGSRHLDGTSEPGQISGEAGRTRDVDRNRRANPDKLNGPR